MSDQTVSIQQFGKRHEELADGSVTSQSTQWQSNLRHNVSSELGTTRWPVARGISWGLAIATVLVLSWALYELRFGFEPSDHLERATQLFWACLAMQLCLGAVLIFRIVGVWRSQQKSMSSSRLFRRLVGFSVFIAGAPTLFIAITAIVVMTMGLRGWFGGSVGNVVTLSLSTADSFLDVHLETQRSKALRMAELASPVETTLERRLVSRGRLNFFLQNNARKVGIDAVVMFDKDFTVYGEAGQRIEEDLRDLISVAVLEALDAETNPDTAVSVLTSRGDRTFAAVMPLANVESLYLLTVNAISDSILKRIETTATAHQDFVLLSGNLERYEQLFILLFAVLALALALFAAWGSLRLAIELVRPILRISTAAEQLGQGNWSARVPQSSNANGNELDTLAQSFNGMARDLGQQQAALQDANAAIEERRRFTEAVLAGVSAGVIGLDARGNIDLPNDTASHLLDKNLDDWIGLPLIEAVPGFETLLSLAYNDPEGVFTEEVTITRRNGSPRQLLANAVAEAPNGIIVGYVFTFDDVTEFQLAQRRAAWSDVARRIAHEIKNPLTPIQLSAERLKRRYLNAIDDRPELFGELVDTIVRQVGEIGRMVDEFSGFARMPEPRMAEHDLRDIVRQAVFLQTNAFPSVDLFSELPDVAVIATVDEQLMSQAIINLVKNAAESLEALIANNKLDKGIIAVQLLMEPDPDDPDITGVRIEVRDNGLGYPVNLMPKLMEPYVTTRDKGTGLGLAIVRKVMEDHDGRLRLLNGNTQENLCGARAILLFS